MVFVSTITLPLVLIHIDDLGLQYARRKHNVKKVLIFDWDAHHGDGTEHLTYDDPDTLFISLHRYDDGKFYPSSGHPKRIGGKYA